MPKKRYRMFFRSAMYYTITDHYSLLSAIAMAWRKAGFVVLFRKDPDQRGYHLRSANTPSSMIITIHDRVK